MHVRKQSQRLVGYVCKYCKSEDLLWQLECKKCGKRSEWADSERGVIEKWNEMIKREMDDD